MALQKVPFWTGARTVMLTYEPGLDTPPDVPPPPPPPPPPDFPEVGAPFNAQQLVQGEARERSAHPELAPDDVRRLVLRRLALSPDYYRRRVEISGDDEDIAPPPDRPGYAPDPIHGGGYEPIEPTRPPARDGRSNVGNMVLGGGFLFAFLVLVTSKGKGRR